MTIDELLALGEPMEYGPIEPCCIADCKMRAMDYVAIADDEYELCDFHYTQYLVLYEHNRHEREVQEQSARTEEAIQIFSRMLGPDTGSVSDG